MKSEPSWLPQKISSPTEREATKSPEPAGFGNRPFHLVTWVLWGKRKLTCWSLQLAHGTTIYFIKAQNVVVLLLQL